MTRYFVHRPRRSRIFLAALAALALMGLAGCSTFAEPALPQETLVVEATPMFASDEEALAAAELAFANYLEVGDQVARDGGRKPERLKALVSNELYSQELEGLIFFRGGALHATGSSSYDSWAVQSLESTEGRTSIDAYACVRFSDLRILNDVGGDVTPASRDNNLPMIIGLETVSGSREFIVETSNVWTGANFC